MSLNHAKGFRMLAKLASAPVMFGVSVVHEIKEELRQKSPSERKAKAEADYKEELRDIEHDIEIETLKAKVDELRRRKGPMTRKEIRLAELRAELKELEEEG